MEESFNNKQKSEMIREFHNANDDRALPTLSKG